MPSKARSVSKKAAANRPPVAATPNPQPEPCSPSEFSTFAKEWREKVNKELQGYFNGFLDDGTPEEKAFLNETFLIWEGQHGKPGVRSFKDHEVPLFTALSEAVNGRYMVSVDSREMQEEVENFITKKLEAGWKQPKQSYSWREPEDVTMARIRKLLLRHVDYFSYNCRQEDMNFLIDALEQWETIVNNAELNKGTKHHMAAAAEI